MITKTIRWVLYGIFIGTLLYGCKDDELELVSTDLETAHIHTDAFGRTIETVAAKEVSFILDHISAQRAGYLPASGNRTQDEGANPFGTVDVDHIMALINDEAATDKTYTFGMVNPDGIIDEFANLIIRTIDGEIIKAYIQVYSPTPAYLETYGLAISSTFSGTMRSYFLEGSGIDLSRTQGIQHLGEGLEPVKVRVVEGGESMSVEIMIDCDPPDTDNDSTDPNDDDTGGTTGSGSGDPGDPNGDGHTDTGTTDTNPGGDEGGAGTDGGGAQDCDFEVYTNCCNRNICLPHGPRGPEPICTGTNTVIIDCGSPRTAETTGNDKSANADSISCPNEDVIVIDPACVNENAALSENSPFTVNLSNVNPCIEDETIDTSQVEDNEEFMCIYTALTNTTGFKNLFINTFGESVDINVTFQLVDLPGRAGIIDFAAGAVNVDNQIIQINKTHLDTKHPFWVARTIIHEAIHAYLNVKVFECVSGTTVESLDDKDLEELLIEMEYDCLNTAVSDHDLIFNGLIEHMEEILEEAFPDLVAPEDFNPNINYFPPNANTDDPIPFGWTSGYHYISLSGLSGTSGFQTRLPIGSDSLYFFNSYNADINNPNTMNHNTCD